MDLFAALVLLSLAFAEGVVENVIVHASVELCALILIAGILMKITYKTCTILLKFEKNSIEEVVLIASNI